MKETVTPEKPAKVLIITAFAALFVIWGSTYLGIMIAIKSIPPFFMLGTRFFVAGLLLYIWCVIKGEKTPSLKLFTTIGVGGILMLFMGNGAVTWSEQYLPTGIAAIVVATVPLWFVLLDKRQWKSNFSNKLIIVGFITGFIGVLLLFAGKGTIDFFGDKLKLLSFFVLITGTIGWATGSLYSKYKKVEASVTMKAAVQMLAAGIVALLTGLLTNEQEGFDVNSVSLPSILALLYLIIMGSLITYMAYIWLLSVRPPSLVGTYAYVNPVVAVFLGWLIAGEAITKQQIGALAVILAGVILVNFSKEQKKVIVSEVTS
ncbi:EamA family transporter [Segetibacter koreensis]|uniref:EamA family transporter n=1 Tax=Segetibacter koreensis TaxID=398037 RepID=UPI00037474A7|nr:EamA family transporter [Segetibacter koreensis]